MPSHFYHKQKSLKRRFLLIFGLAALRCVCAIALGLTIMFWDKLNLSLTPIYRILAGSLFIVYGIIRFILIFRRQPDE